MGMVPSTDNVTRLDRGKAERGRCQQLDWICGNNILVVGMSIRIHDWNTNKYNLGLICVGTCVCVWQLGEGGSFALGEEGKIGER